MVAPPPLSESIARVAAALWGLRLGQTALRAAEAAAMAEPGLVAGLADRVVDESFGGLGNAQLARRVVGHLDLQAGVFREAEQALKLAFDAAGTSRGRALIDALEWLAQASEWFDPDGWSNSGRIFLARIKEATPHGQTEADNAPFLREVDIVATPGVDVIGVAGTERLVVHAVSRGGVSTLDDTDQAYLSGRGRIDYRIDGDLQAWPLSSWAAGADELRIIASPGRDGSGVRLQDGPRYGFDNAPARLVLLQSAVDVELVGGRVWPSNVRDLTLALVDTPAGSVDHAIQWTGLASIGEGATQLCIEFMDTYSVSAGGKPLLDLPYAGIRFWLGDHRIDLEDPVERQHDPLSFNSATTYDELLLAVQRLLQSTELQARWPALSQVTAAFGPDFEAVHTINGQSLTGRSIVLSVDPSSALSFRPGHFLNNDGAIGSYHQAIVAEGFRSTAPPVGRVELDHAGSGGLGGDLLLGAVPGSGEPIGRLEISVERSSALQVVAGTGRDLHEVVVRNGLDGGSLAVVGRDGVAAVHAAPVLDNDAAPGGMDPQVHGAWGFTDLRLLDLSAMQGDTTIDAVITAQALVTYADDPVVLRDGVIVRGGHGDDHVALRVDAAVAAVQAFRWTVAGGDGDDRLHLLVDGEPATPPAGRLWLDPGPGDDHLHVEVGALPWVLQLQPGFGHDRLVGLGAAGQLALVDLGGLWLQDPLPARPAAARHVADGGILRVAHEASADFHAAALFTDSGAAAARQQLCIVDDGAGRASFWRATDGAGALGVQLQLMGSLTLEVGIDWMQLPDSVFGG